MQIRLITVGSKQKKWIDLAFKEYQKRLPNEWCFSLEEIRTVKRRKNETSPSIIEREGEKILRKLNNNELLIVLDERGEELSTQELAVKFHKLTKVCNKLCFVIGGPDGLSDAIKEKSNMNWALTKLTLPHGLVRIIFIEQIYRLCTLLSGHPYHRN
ncbi:MAG TPA: 23S rRNA (pseudouridine(1915)-N(3))-methyltransferase RlmH [Woeseiaceae bacterium]|nr:23S rRNA (pseudouridine(1915)-N(3))-methyltransferase RlmH [Woeseiaceae bacterium]